GGAGFSRKPSLVNKPLVGTRSTASLISFRRRKYAADGRIELERDDVEVVPTKHLVCLDTDSRSCSANEAAARVTRAADQLRAAGAEWIYKKVDSVLRGNVLAEIEAIRVRCESARVLLAPANPSLGRTIRNGRYFIRGIPLDETDFRLDPEYPRASSLVGELLGPRVAAVKLCRPGEMLGEFSVAEVENS